MDALRQQDSTRLYLQLPPIWKEVYFETSKNSSLSEYQSHCLRLIALIIEVHSVESSGILIFRDITKLTDKPLAKEGDDRQLLADYAPDRIVFSLKQKVPTEKPKEFALVSPFPFLLVPIISKPSYLVPP